MNEQWLQNPLAGYEDNARHLFSYPDSTVREYVQDIRRFLKWLKERQVVGAEDGKSVILLTVTRDHIEDYIACLSSEGLRATTINRKVFSLKDYASYCISFVMTDTS